MKTVGLKGTAGLVAGAAMMAALATTPARAADLAIETVPAPAPAVAASMFDVAFGFTVTSEYVSRGYSLSDGWAIQPFAEATIGLFYFGYWGSNVADGAWEHDLSVGIRPTWGPWTFDIGYVRYLYSEGGDCCGEIYAKAEVAPIEPLTLNAMVYYDPDSQNTYVEGGAAYALPQNFSVSANIGNQWYGDGSPDDFSWNAGVSWEPWEWVSLDGRYFGGPTADKFVFSITFATSLSGMGLVAPPGSS